MNTGIIESVREATTDTPNSAGDAPVVISSYLALLRKGCEEEVVASMAALEGVEVHGSEHGQYVVTIEADSVDETFERATKITRLEGVTTFSLVHCNFEDEDLGA
ncbi:MAG: chaperone NapD [Coriobacteriales bacterium]|jgi:nitrate reductase NapAB chaperone NapD|nr:chaperone NapD [Coriobacteriales bacterium]